MYAATDCLALTKYSGLFLAKSSAASGFSGFSNTGESSNPQTVQIKVLRGFETGVKAQIYPQTYLRQREGDMSPGPNTQNLPVASTLGWKMLVSIENVGPAP